MNSPMAGFAAGMQLFPSVLAVGFGISVFIGSLRGDRPRRRRGAPLDHGRPEAGGLMKFFPYVFKSLFRKKTRSILTIASIVLPLFVICILGTLLRTLETRPDGRQGDVPAHREAQGLAHELGPRVLHAEDRAAAAASRTIVRMNWFGGAYIDQKPENSSPASRRRTPRRS